MIKKTLKKALPLAIAAAAASTSFNATALNILLTNDDGYGAHGIVVLESALKAAGHSVYVSAPAEDSSGTSGSINTDRGATVGFTDETGEGTNFSVQGSPVDSVSAGLYGLFADKNIDVVISGSNAGQNVGKLTNNSGTVGAAMFALRNGVSSIAVSVAVDLPLLVEVSEISDELKALGGQAYMKGAEAQAKGDLIQAELAKENPDMALVGQLSAEVEALQLEIADLQDQINAKKVEIYAVLAQADARVEDGQLAAATIVVNTLDSLEQTMLESGSEKLLPEGIALNINVPGKTLAEIPKVKMTKVTNDNLGDFQIIMENGELIVDAQTNRLVAGAALGQVPEDYLDLKSEAQALFSGYATISPLDGNLGAKTRADGASQWSELKLNLRGEQLLIEVADGTAQ
ncbi:MAG: 5'/3'-nucleotidase SurE [Pseudomonadales bacterium]|nr:5'/3'-nucleotidase SurE [Pseudomonadales bacterium]